MLRWLTAGESHGPSLVAILEGLPAHVRVTTDDIADALARRRLGYGRGARMKFEQDEVTLLGGVRHGETQGGPVAIEIGNTEWPKWEKVMSADPVDPVELEALARNAALTRPRPGHADLVGMQKYDFDEARPILERASARETAARVALGRVASNFLEQAVGARIVSHVVELGGVQAPAGLVPGARRRRAPRRRPGPLPRPRRQRSDGRPRSTRPTRTATPSAASSRSSSTGCRPGLGSHVHWDRRLDSRLAGALMGIQAIKGVEVGDGFELAATPGSLAHDEIVHDRRRASGARRGRSGGTEGGMSTGEVLRVRAAMKPIATVPRALRTVDVATGEAAVAHHQRSDVCAVPAAGIVAEAMVALVLADAVLEKFGGDSVQETRRNAESLPRHPEVPVSLREPARGAGRARWAPARPRSPALLARRLGRAPCATPTPTSRRPRAARSPTSSSSRARTHFRDLERGRGRRGARASTTACWRSAAERCSTRRPASCWPGSRSSSCGSASPTR